MAPALFIEMGMYKRGGCAEEESANDGGPDGIFEFVPKCVGGFEWAELVDPVCPDGRRCVWFRSFGEAHI